MKVSSLNDHIKPPKGAELIRAGLVMGWFVISYRHKEGLTEFYFNDQGREVFRTDYPQSRLKRWWEFLKECYANSDFAPLL
jgi:hypothetical protein